MKTGIRSLTASDFADLTDLAGTIWRHHYTPIIGAAQIDYMLAGRFTPVNLARYLDSSERWLELLVVDDRLSGYCSYALEADPAVLKLEQLYLLPALHGRGLGVRMLRYVEARACELHRNRIRLTVNRQNHSSVAFYLHNGFTVRDSVVIDIGNGFVMDDHVMEKRI